VGGGRRERGRGQENDEMEEVSLGHPTKLWGSTQNTRGGGGEILRKKFVGKGKMRREKTDGLEVLHNPKKNF